MSNTEKRFTYSTEVNKRGTWRIRHWVEYFTDESTGEKFPIKRSEPIKLNGQKVVWYPTSAIKRMTQKERKQIFG